MPTPKIYIIKNQQIEVHVSNLGIIIQKIILHKNHLSTDVVLGFDDIHSYQNSEYLKNYPYFGAVIGRFANRIGGASFLLNGKQYCLSKNAGNDHLHGGIEGFDKKYWTVIKSEKECIAFEYLSENGEEGYPGNLHVKVELSVKNYSLQIHYQATCDEDCFVNITHHPYFNLNSQETTIINHLLQVFSNQRLETKNLIPTGNIVECQDYTNFQTPHHLQELIHYPNGLDHTYLYKDDHKIKKMAQLSDPKSDIHLVIYSDFPAMQIYSGTFIHVKNGKQGKTYPPFSGIAFEPQMYPDAPNHSNFPSALLSPQKTFNRTILYDFIL